MSDDDGPPSSVTLRVTNEFEVSRCSSELEAIGILRWQFKTGRVDFDSLRFEEVGGDDS